MTDPLGGWEAPPAPPGAVVAAVVRACAVGLDAPLPAPVHRSLDELDGGAAVPAAALPGAAIEGAAADADLLAALPGLVHERMRSDRAARGAVYTPAAVAVGLVAMTAAVAPEVVTDPSAAVLDPSVGGGAFLLAVASHRRAGGASPVAAVATLAGYDVEPVAVAATRFGLALWLAAAGELDGVAWEGLVRRVALGDVLAAEPRDTPTFDLVVGNPPFLGQLRGRTARDAPTRRALRERFGGAVLPYTDASALFLLAGLDRCRPGGVVHLIQPASVLSARDGTGVRAAVLDRATVDGFWRGGTGAFAADVDVVSVLVRRRAEGAEPTAGPGAEPVRAPAVRRWDGPTVAAAPPAPVSDDALDAESWGALLADLVGVPGIPHWMAGPARERRSVGDLATATAGFRDEYYAIGPAVCEEGEAGEGGEQRRTGAPRLVTVGLLDLARLRWGTEPARFHRRRWARPVVALDRLEPGAAVAVWGRERLVPKVLVATQSPVIEVVVDRAGDLWPSTPVITVAPTDPTGPAGADALWSLAAAIASPHAVAWAATRFPGTALAPHALKLSAWQVARIPLPLDPAAWRRGALAFEAASRAAEAGDADGWAAHLWAFGQAMAAAYGDPQGDDVLAWWRGRVPGWRAGSL